MGPTTHGVSGIALAAVGRIAPPRRTRRVSRIRAGRGKHAPRRRTDGWASARAAMCSFAAMVVLSLWATRVHAGLLAPGAAFPPWELTDQTGARVSSRDLAGRSYLMWFYPKAMTPGCTVEGQGLRDRAAAFRERGVEILGVSFDPPEANAAFVARDGFPFRLLSDRDRSLALAVGAAASTQQPVAARISYLVGPDGRVRRAYPDVVPAAHADTVLADLLPPAPTAGATPASRR